MKKKRNWIYLGILIISSILSGCCSFRETSITESQRRALLYVTQTEYLARANDEDDIVSLLCSYYYGEYRRWPDSIEKLQQYQRDQFDDLRNTTALEYAQHYSFETQKNGDLMIIDDRQKKSIMVKVPPTCHLCATNLLMSS